MDEAWRDLPDPFDSSARITVSRLDASWRHIAKHIDSKPERTCWAELFGGESRRAEAVADRGGKTPPSERASKALAGQVRRSLERPFVMARAATEWKRARWVLVLPSGALAVIAFAGKSRSARLATCYFPKVACRQPHSGSRWRKTAVRMVVRHAVFVSGLGLLPPGEEQALAALAEESAACSPDGTAIRHGESRNAPSAAQARTLAGSDEKCQGVRFVTVEQWGFEKGLRGMPWRGRFPDWEAAEERSGALFPLRPRFRMPSFVESDHG